MIMLRPNGLIGRSSCGDFPRSQGGDEEQFGNRRVAPLKMARLDLALRGDDMRHLLGKGTRLDD